MSGMFRRTADGVISARMDDAQAALVRDLARQVIMLVDDGTGGPETDSSAEAALAALGISDGAALSDDPALARLLPDAYEDSGDAREFRRYTERGLRAAKVEAARVVLDTTPVGGGVVRLDAEQAQAYLRALNDVRLALGTRLEVTEETYAELDHLDPRDPRLPALVAYDWLSTMQDTLVRALDSAIG